MLGSLLGMKDMPRSCSYCVGSTSQWVLYCYIGERKGVGHFIDYQLHIIEVTSSRTINGIAIGCLLAHIYLGRVGRIGADISTASWYRNGIGKRLVVAGSLIPLRRILITVPACIDL